MTTYDEDLTLTVAPSDEHTAGLIAVADISLFGEATSTFVDVHVKPVDLTFSSQGETLSAIFSLRVYHTYNSIDYEMPIDTRENYGWRNTQGTPCRSIHRLTRATKGYSNPLPDKYTLSYAQAAVDGAVSGVGFELTDLPDALQRFVVECGGFYILAEDRFSNVMLWDNLLLGSTSPSVAFKIENTSGSTLHNLTLSLANRAIVTQSAFGVPIFSLAQKAGYFPPAVSSAAITFDNLVSGTPNTIQMLIGGYGSDVMDQGGDVFTQAQGLACDGSTIYTFVGGTDYEGLIFVLDTTVSESSTALLDIYENIWEFSTDDTAWVTEETLIGDLEDGESTLVYVRAHPFSGLDVGATHGLLQIQTDEGEISLPLSANLIDSPESPSLDSSLIIRCSVITQAFKDDMTHFGITLAS